MHKLVLLRHGESTWNKENRFTGWTDVDLSERGRDEAREAGRLLKEGGYVFDIAYTSVLKRAIRHARGSRSTSSTCMWIPVDEELAAERAALRRAAGAEQGRDRREARRSAGQDLAPQLRHSAAAARTRRRAASVARSALRRARARRTCRSTESLKDTVARFLPYWHDTIAPAIRVGQAGADRRARQQPARAREVPRRRLRGRHRRAEHPDRHSAGLRARRRLEPMRHYYLGDPEAAAAAAARVAAQAKQ